MSRAHPVVTAWETFQNHTRETLTLRPPETETEYDVLVVFADELTSSYNCNAQPYAALFDLVAAYLDTWERQHDAELKNVQVPPFEMLAYYLEERDVSAYQLAKDLNISQGNLSAILNGRRGISKDLAKKLAGYFDVSVELFI